jgi:hypothetical protein
MTPARDDRPRHRRRVIDDPCEHPHIAVFGYDLVGVARGHAVPVQAVGGVIGSVDAEFWA